jgi:DNA-binding transcriptional MerR regulator/predicted enzyme related to lactoylglutathione lyase
VIEQPARHLLSIGRFAAVTGLTVTALRHYDEVGLLAPAHVDPATGYRWYETAQAPRADVIRRLRAVDLPLDEVAAVVDAVVDAVGDPDRVRALLDVHERRLAERAAATLAIQDQLSTLAKELEAMALPTTGEGAAVGPVAAVRIFSHDLAAARAFYGSNLGLAELTVGDGWAVFDGGAVQIVLEQVQPADAGHHDAGLVGRFVGVSFSVDDAQLACDRLTALGVEIVGQPGRQPWGGILAHIADPDRNVLTLVEYPPPA